MSEQTRHHVDERHARQVAEAARESAWLQPSFGKQLFLGDFQLGLIHPQPPPDEDLARRGEEFCARLREFCETSVSGEVIERDAKIPDEVIKGLAALGAFGMKIAPEYGGLGLTNLYYNRALMIAGSVSPALAAMLSAHQSIGVPQPLALFGTDEQKQHYLPRCARGEISAFLLTEPDVGSDPARLSTTATPSEDGSQYVLNGVKLWTTNGVIADLLVVMARVPKSEGHRGGITAFVVDGHEPDRQGGPGPEDRPDHAEHRPPFAAGELRRGREGRDEDRQGVVAGTGAVGAPGRRARGGSQEDLVHRGDHLRP